MSAKSERAVHQAATWGGIALGVMFVASGVTKLLHLPMHVHMFHGFGLDTWMLIPVGVIEAGSGILLFNARTRFWGALGVCAVMLGASAVHLASGVMPAMVFLNAAIFAAAAWVASKSGMEAGAPLETQGRPTGLRPTH